MSHFLGRLDPGISTVVNYLKELSLVLCMRGWDNDELSPSMNKAMRPSTNSKRMLKLWKMTV